MRVISLGPLRAFWTQHPDAEVPLRLWYRTVRHARWRSLHDVRTTYPHADAIRTAGSGTLTVFDIGGNEYRLVARVRYDYQLVKVRQVLTHRDYDCGAWKE